MYSTFFHPDAHLPNRLEIARRVVAQLCALLILASNAQAGPGAEIYNEFVEKFRDFIGI